MVEYLLVEIEECKSWWKPTMRRYKPFEERQENQEAMEDIQEKIWGN
jgi:hypothetical protein